MKVHRVDGPLTRSSSVKLDATAEEQFIRRTVFLPIVQSLFNNVKARGEMYCTLDGKFSVLLSLTKYHNHMWKYCFSLFKWLTYIRCGRIERRMPISWIIFWFFDSLSRVNVCNTHWWWSHWLNSLYWKSFENLFVLVCHKRLWWKIIFQT